MQPILLIAGLAVGVAMLSTGFLAGNNQFNLWVQELGFGEEQIDAPLEHAAVDFEVERQTYEGPDGVFNTLETPSYDDSYKNIITECSFHSDEALGDDAEVQCKLLSWPRTSDGTMIECVDPNGNPTSTTEVAPGIFECQAPNTIPDRVIVCEGNKIFANGYQPSTVEFIPIIDEVYDFACDVQNIDAVKLVVKGEEPYMESCPIGTEHIDLNNDLVIDNGECFDIPT